MSEEGVYVDIYTDGSAFKNPGGPGGIAAIAYFSDDRKPLILVQEKLEKTTNNRAEFLAIIKAIQQIRILSKKEKVQGFTLWTDSQYFYNNRFRPNTWRKNGWENRDGRIIENQDLWKQWLSIQSWTRIPFRIEWNKGKKTEVLKLIDRLAKEAAKSFIIKKDYGYRSAKISRSKSGGKKAPSLFPANGQQEIIRIYGYELKRSKLKQEYKIKFDLFSQNEKCFNDKHYAYFILESIEEKDFHRYRSYDAIFNNNPNHPVILSLTERDDSTIE